MRDGVPVTTVARTLLDLADVLERQALRRVITEAEYTHQFDLTAINAVVHTNPGRRSAKLMAAVGARRHRTRSALEQRFLGLLDRNGVEEPQSGVWIEGYELDFVWKRVGLAVELDGLAAHTTRSTFNADRCVTGDDLAQAGVNVPSRSRASSKPPRRSSTSPASAR